jgi:hypothetical protein
MIFLTRWLGETSNYTRIIAAEAPLSQLRREPVATTAPRIAAPTEIIRILHRASTVTLVNSCQRFVP